VTEHDRDAGNSPERPPPGAPVEVGEVEVVVVVVVDVANVMGSRPDGWWRDRHGAATRLLAELAALRGAELGRPDGPGVARVLAVHAVVEGAARRATGPDEVTVLAAASDGDDEVVREAERLAAAGRVPLVVTADRGLRRRLPASALVAGPRWLDPVLGR
jgi:hypothetical protein